MVMVEKVLLHPGIGILASDRIGGIVEDKMYSNFMEHGMEYAKQAVKEDDTGNYSNALKLYMNALEYFQAQLKYEKNQQIVKFQ
uniref:MIT domain-containing protein n=1 Tax=Salix viminalis TaxID=40686 RepID=A0A6N2MH07_SALVM